MTTLLDPAGAPADEVAALYHERWEGEGALRGDEGDVAGRAADAAHTAGRPCRAGALRLLLPISPCAASSMTPAATPAATPTRCLSSTRCASSGGICPSMPRFPPRRRRRMVELILIEIMAVPAERSRGKHRPRVVKRKMSGFPTKSRAAPVAQQVFHYDAHIQSLLPKTRPSPASRRRPPAPSRSRGSDPAPSRRRRTAARPGSSMSDPGAAAVCHEPFTAIAST